MGGNTKINSIIVRAAGIAAVVFISVLMHSSPASADTVVHAAQLNVRGSYTGALIYVSDPARLHPLVITANEVCSAPPGAPVNKLNELIFSLAVNGYSSYGMWPQNSSSGVLFVQ